MIARFNSSGSQEMKRDVDDTSVVIGDYNEGSAVPSPSCRTVWLGKSVLVPLAYKSNAVDLAKSRK